MLRRLGPHAVGLMRLYLTGAAPLRPRPRRTPASIASSAPVFGMRIALPSGAPPVLTDVWPPAWMMVSNAARSTTRSLMSGNASACHGSMTMVSPSL